MHIVCVCVCVRERERERERETTIHAVKMTFSCAGFFCSGFPLGLSYDPYAGTLTKTGTWENVSRALEVLGLPVCVCVCVCVCIQECAWVKIHAQSWWCLFLLISRVCLVIVSVRVCVHVYLHPFGIQSIWRDTQPVRISVLPWLIFSKGLESLIPSETPNPL